MIAQPAMKPPFSYYGGKGRMAQVIADLLPPHTVYVEPFAGSCAVMFKKGRPPATASNYREAINDQNGEVVNFYRVLQDPPSAERLIERLSVTPYARAEYARAVETAAQGDNVDRAWAFFVNVSMTFGNRISRNEKGSEWSTSVISRQHASTWARRCERVGQYVERMRTVYIEQDEALNIIERWDSPQTCFYLDPPYPRANQGHYGGYTLDDFAALCDLIERCSGSFVLSNYDNPGPRAEWERMEFSAYASASGEGCVGKRRDKSVSASARIGDAKKRTEVIWRVDRSRGIRKELRGVVAQGVLFK